MDVRVPRVQWAIMMTGVTALLTLDAKWTESRNHLMQASVCTAHAGGGGGRR